MEGARPGGAEMEGAGPGAGHGAVEEPGPEGDEPTGVGERRKCLHPDLEEELDTMMSRLLD